MSLNENNICEKCGAEALYYIDELNCWLCENCKNEEEELEKISERLEKKFNKRVYSFDIAELLNCLSKDEIYNIARNLGLAKISGLKKDELLNNLIENYESLIEERLLLFEEERYRLLRSYLDKDGVKIFNDIDEEEVEKSAYFIQQGFIYPTLKDGIAVFLMPQIVQKIIEDKNTLDYRRIIKQNGEIINVYRGMNKAYGILNIESIKSILSQYDLYNDNIEELIRESGYYYSEYREDSKLFVNNEIQNIDSLLETIEKECAELEYAKISKEELLVMSNRDYGFATKAGKAFCKEFSNTFNSNREMLQAIMGDLSIDIQENEVNESIDKILDVMEVDEENVRNVAANLMSKFANKIRIWKYKGYSINDIKALKSTVKNEINIGRNEPCICGSGKKYKKCCGKNK